MTDVRLPPAGLLALAVAAQHLLSRRRRPTVASVLAGGALVSASGFVLADSLRRFHRDRTTVDPLRPHASSALIQDGPFAISRNPIYLAFGTLLAAHAIARRTPEALVPAAAFLGALDRWQVPAEERALREQFGEDYADYAARVPRWA